MAQIAKTLFIITKTLKINIEKLILLKSIILILEDFLFFPFPSFHVWILFFYCYLAPDTIKELGGRATPVYFVLFWIMYLDVPRYYEVRKSIAQNTAGSWNSQIAM